MTALPKQVVDYLLRHFLQARNAAYVVADSQSAIVEWGGDLAVYGAERLEPGSLLQRHFDYLHGISASEDSVVHLPFVQTSSGVYADVHFFSTGARMYLVLLDVSEEESRLNLLQQTANDLSLLRQAQAKLLERSLNQHVPPVEKMFTFRQEGERREASVLFADLRGFTAYAENHPPESVFQTLHVYLRAMTEPVHSAGGFVDKIIGDAVMAIFAVLPAADAPAACAVRAASGMIESIRDVVNSGSPAMQGVGIGVATGEISVALLKHKDHVTVNAVGNPVRIAAGLERQAGAGEILLDAVTHRALRDRHRFVEKSFTIPGMNEPFKAFSLMVS